MYNRSMKELDDFFKLNWKVNKPKIFLVKDRKSIDKLMGQKTQDWIVGWVNDGNVFVLDKDNYEKESCHKYSDERYFSLIKHELAHVFTQAYSCIFDKSIEPDWLWEGVAIYLSDQNKTFKKPSELKGFLQHYSKDNKSLEVYKESGFAIELLVNNFGKQKLLRLIKSLKGIDSKEDFANKFKEIYGFDLNYKNFNKFFKK